MPVLRKSRELASAHADIAIRNALALYCRAMDRMDDDLALSLFSPGATVSYRPDLFTGRAVDFIQWVHGVHAGLAGSVHRMATACVRVDPRCGTAVSETPGHVLLLEADGQVRHSFGRYVDRWERDRGRWVIVRRDYERDVAYRERPDDLWVAPDHRAPHDFSYGLLDQAPGSIS